MTSEDEMEATDENTNFSVKEDNYEEMDHHERKRTTTKESNERLSISIGLSGHSWLLSHAPGCVIGHGSSTTMTWSSVSDHQGQSLITGA